MLKICTIICSYNTAEMTDEVVKALLKGKHHDIYVLDNSTTKEQVYKSDKVNVVDLGRENIGFGGMHDYIFKESKFREYDFVGIFNNDIYDIPENYFETIEKRIDGSEGIVSSAFYKNGSGWEQMWRIHQDGKREVFHVEDIACYFNTKLFDKFAEFIPYHFYGTQDIVLSQLARKEGFKLYVVDDVEIGHLLAGAREKAGVKDEYLRCNSNSLVNWLERFPEIKKLYDEYLKQISRKVCVIIPNYNHNELVERAVGSVLLNKTKCDIILVDDYSEKEPDIEGLPVRYLRHDRNRGLAQTRNTAIANTKSPYILPLDADDELMPGAIDKMLEEKGDVIYGNLIWRESGSKMEPGTKKGLKHEHFLVNNQIFGTSLYKRDLWGKVGGYWEEHKEFYEDWDFWARLAKEGAEFKYIDLDVYKYAGIPGGMCDRLGKNREYNVNLIRQHIQ